MSVYKMTRAEVEPLWDIYGISTTDRTDVFMAYNDAIYEAMEAGLISESAAVTITIMAGAYTFARKEDQSPNG